MTMVPTQATPESELAYRGALRGTTHDLFNYAKIGEEMVEIPDIADILLPDVDPPYHSWRTFNVSTVLGEDNVAGDGSPVFIVDENYGKAGFEWTADTYTLDGTAYQFKVLADVKSISAATGSAKGGHLLTITGNGFLSDTSKITATVNGNACTVEEASLHEIKCRTTESLAATHAQAPYPGGSGLKRHLWGDLSGASVSTIETLVEGDAHITDILCTGSSNVNRGQTYKQKMVGLFRAPRTGDYQFYLTSDDQSRVWLSTDSDPANKGDPLIDFSTWTYYRNHMFFYDSNKSELRSLTAGNFYYMEIWHAQGTGSDHFSLGVQVPGDGGDYPNKMFEVQKISIVPDIVREIQTVGIAGTVTGGNLRFIYNQEVTDEVAWPDDGNPSCSSVKSALQDIGTGSLSCVATDIDGGGVTYAFTFDSPTSEARPLITAHTTGLNGSGLSKTSELTQEPSP